jgi:arylsulfatase A-like enzyme
MWVILVVLALIIKKTFFSHISLGSLIGLNQIMRLMIGGIFVAFLVWLGRKYIVKIPQILNERITPVVWVFIFLLILAVPLSLFVYKRGTTEDKYSPEDTIHAASSLGEKRPNILLITMDALTARDMQVYGYHRPTTPFITEWAKDAILFRRAYSSSNWTTPSAVSLMTGQRPWTHRVSHLTYLYPFRNYKNNLPNILKDYGYINYAFVQNYNAHPDTLGVGSAFLKKDKYYTFWSISILPGWERFITRANILVGRLTNSPITAKWIFTHPIFKLQKFFLSDKDIDKTFVPAENVYNRFLEYISKNPKQPFFAWLHVEPPHLPFLPPKPYMGMFGDPEKFNTYNKQEWSGLLGSQYKPERQKEVDILKKRLDEFILYSDQAFKLFLSRLAETIDMSNTIIIFSSDHGTSLERGLVGHGGYQMYESQVHIPLIIKIPGKIKGKIIDMLVEHVDIAPTILDLVGIPIPEWMEGRSLVPLIEGRSLKPLPIFSMQLEHGPLVGDHPITKGTIAVWDGDYKLIYYLGWKDKKTQLFNLKADPDESQDIFKEKPEIAQRLMRLIKDNLSRANKRIM